MVLHRRRHFFQHRTSEQRGTGDAHQRVKHAICGVPGHGPRQLDPGARTDTQERRAQPSGPTASAPASPAPASPDESAPAADSPRAQRVQSIEEVRESMVVDGYLTLLPSSSSSSAAPHAHFAAADASLSASELRAQRRVLLTQRWATEHPRVFFASCHPGWVDTDGLKDAQAMAGFYSLMRPTLRTPEQGGDTIAWLAKEPAHGGDGSSTSAASGRYYWDRSARRIDLWLSGTRASESDVDELLSFLKETTGV